LLIAATRTFTTCHHKWKSVKVNRSLIIAQAIISILLLNRTLYLCRDIIDLTKKQYIFRDISYKSMLPYTFCL